MTASARAPGQPPTTAHPAPTFEGKAMTDSPTAHNSLRPAGRPAGRSWSKVALTGGLALALGLLAACGTSSASGSPVAVSNGTAAPSSGQASPSGQGGQGGPGRAARSAVSWTIAAATPGTIQVQATSSQTTVNFSNSTTTTDSVA